MEKHTNSKVLILLVIMLVLIQGLQAQEYTGDLLLATQTDVDAFNYSEVTGNLTIEGSDIVDLTSLLVLTSVGGDFIIQNNLYLTSLDGLLNLTSVGEDIYVNDNSLLLNLDALLDLTSIGGNIEIDNNSELLNIDGLKNITSANGYLKIRRNDKLDNLRGLQKITTIAGGLEVYHNDAITNLDGLESITSLGDYLKILTNNVLTNLNALQNINLPIGNVEISKNELLIDLSGLRNITEIEGFLKVYGNKSITNLEGLHNITSINDYVKIYDNDKLTSLEGLQNLTSVNGNLDIYDNVVLSSFCDIYPLLNGGGLTGVLTIAANESNPSEQEIIDGGSCSEEIVPHVTILTLGVPRLAIGEPFSQECGIWDIPVTVKEFNNIGTISLKFNYNNSELSYEGVDLNSSLSEASVSGTSPGRFSLAYFGDEISLDDDEVLFTVHFSLIPNFQGTPFILSWSDVPGDCEIAGLDGEEVYNGEFADLDVNVITDVMPEINCPADIEIENDEGVCGAIVEYEVPAGTDNCSDPITVQISGLESGDLFPIGTTTNTFVVTDSQENSVECSFMVTVIDSEVPVIINCPEDIVINTDDRVSCDQVVSWELPTATDNCDLISFTCDYEPEDVFPVGTTTVIYTATDNAIPANVSTCSFDVTVVDNTAPSIDVCAPSQSAIVTDGCSVEMPDFLSTSEISENCGTLILEQSPAAGTWMEYSEDSYEVTITATDGDGNGTSCTSSFIVEKGTISGTVFYNNSLQTSMNNISLTLSPGDLNCVTDEDGNYEFNELCAGDYTITVKGNDKPVGYINATDAGAANKWGTSVREIEYINFLAGDVSENNLYINSTDALAIQDYFVNETKFDRGPWSYFSKGVKINSNTIPFAVQADHPEGITMNINGANVLNFDILALCTGDFNGSFTPLKSTASALSVEHESSTSVAANQRFELPFRAGSAMEVGAVSVILDVPIHLVEIQDVVINGSDVSPSWSLKNNEFRIGWNSIDPVFVSAGESLFTIKLKTTDEFEIGEILDFDLAFSPLNELADGNFEVIQGAKLSVNKIKSGFVSDVQKLDGSTLSFSNYPNPFKGSTSLMYSLPVDGAVNISIYNQLGELIAFLVNTNQKAGKYMIQDYGNTLKPGMYVSKLELKNQNLNMRKTIKLIVFE